MNKDFFNDINGYKLDKKQIKIIKSKRKNILVVAGAGSGKSLTIVGKIKYLLDVLKVNEKDILCISFTNDAVNNLKKDINRNIDIITFHKLALKIIGKNKELLTENMLYDIIINTFCNDSLFGIFKLSKKEMYNLVERFINLFKSNNYDLNYFTDIIRKANKIDKILLKEIMKCYICYESYLNKENIIDFNDMINIAINKLDEGFILKYKYIIIDEYQDTSYTKYLLINKLQKIGNSKVLAVGDDFQSIYRFSGSNIELFTKFKKYFRFPKIYKLNKTYRNSKELIKIAGKFILKNNYQINKKMKSDIKIQNPVNIVYSNDLNYSINEIIKQNKINNLFILSRNNKDLVNIKLEKINYKSMTVHKSKGLQEDYVFLINVFDKVGGFPNKIVDHPILKYVNKYKEFYKYEEERRLFYVALTRCKKKIFIFTDENNCSIFIKEIIKDNKIPIIKF